MGSLFRWLIWSIGAMLLSLRYRVRITGLDKVRGLRKALILPNHPAYSDPPLVLKTLWPALRPRPMLFARMFRNPLLFWLPRALNAIRVPDLQQHSAEARRQTEEAIQAIIEGLRAGHNHLLWPAGRVYRSDHESLGAARSFSEILSAVPDAQVVLVRTRGLWGSMFSYAKAGGQPNLVVCLLKGIGILLANLIFFAPRRRVHMTIERIDRSQLPDLSREKLNPFLEAWYNAPGPETPAYVPYHFLFGRKTFEFPDLSKKGEVDLAGVKQRTREQIAELIAEKLHGEPQGLEYQPATKLEQFALDSLDRMELSLEVERRFGFTGARVPETVGDLWALAEGQLQSAPPPPVPPQWFKREQADARPEILADTIPQAFVKRCIVSAHDVAVADDISGALTYRRLLVGAMLMSRRLRELPSPNIGIMLPAGVVVDLLFFASHLAGKLPVLMNWTTGPSNLAHAARTMDLSHIVTSRRFIDRMNIGVEGADYVFVEDLRRGIGRVEKLLALMRATLAPGSILQAAPNPGPDSPAVVLFTSGSEKAPKAVPLTHRNIISNIRAGLEAFQLSTRDVLVGFLPSFHSFGLTVTTVLPVLGGARVVHHPDPTDASAIARKIGSYKGTIVCGTPTFLSYILEHARPGELDTIRMAVAGAEKCPMSLYERASQLLPHARLLEGYGITECAPLVSCNRLDHAKPGSIGLPFPGVEVRVVDIETYEPLPPGALGMLLVRGSNVFPGYVGENAPDPFVQRDGERWYVTGDLARIDEDGFIWFSARLKRFLKAGGEMISLPAIEEPLATALSSHRAGPARGSRRCGRRRRPANRPLHHRACLAAQANEILQEHGLRGIMRLDEVRRLEKIPTLGTGKTDYKVLRAMIQPAAVV